MILHVHHHCTWWNSPNFYLSGEGIRRSPPLNLHKLSTKFQKSLSPKTWTPSMFEVTSKLLLDTFSVSSSATVVLPYDWSLVMIPSFFQQPKMPRGKTKGSGIWPISGLSESVGSTWGVNFTSSYHGLQVRTSSSSDEKWSYPRLELYRWYVYM